MTDNLASDLVIEVSYGFQCVFFFFYDNITVF
jgi:hypothetical protein